MLYCRQLDLLQFLEDVLPLTQEGSFLLTSWRGVCTLAIASMHLSYFWSEWEKSDEATWLPQ